MARNSKIVNTFLLDLFDKLKILRDAELAEIKNLKNGDIYSWDIKYYQNQIKKTKYNIDQDVVKEYFVLDNVLKHLFTYFQNLLNLRFTRGIKEAWHEDVWEWLIYDKCTSKIIGKFYLDLFPRKNKFSHMACFTLKHATYSDPYSVCAMVCNFPRGNSIMPSLLTHSDVETLYHEFGHIMHNICGITKYIEFSGCQTETDFVEIPSQTLENWCWEFNTIKELSRHYLTNEPMPDEMINNLIKTRNVDSGLVNCRQLFYSLIDQELHINEYKCHNDIIDTFYNLYEKIIGYKCQDDVLPLLYFSHIVDGYDAQYYSYLWSKVYADDIYQVLIQDIKTYGEKYKKEILEPGGSKDAIVMIKNFLGRKASCKSFLNNIGLSTSITGHLKMCDMTHSGHF